MACSIAVNIPLQRLRKHLGLPEQCHSSIRSERCLHGLPSGGVGANGIIGAAFGYCQGLVNRSTEGPAEHTNLVTKTLEEIHAPWNRSHELFWGYKPETMSATEFIELAIRPLEKDGRVPVLITGLDPSEDRAEIETIFNAKPKLAEGETMLVRLILSNEKSINAVVELIRKIIQNSEVKSKMPQLWPLLQGHLTIVQWNQLKTTLGNFWKYVNVAINPFTPPEIITEIERQVTVAQIVVGNEFGITDDVINIIPGNDVSNSLKDKKYSLKDYFTTLLSLDTTPTLIVCGPSKPEWKPDENKRQLSKLLMLVKKYVNEILWKTVCSERQKLLWELQA